MIYVIRGQQSDNVKIGYSVNPAARLRVLQTGNPDYLYIVGTAPGDRALEHQLHQQCSGSRLAGEWFSFDGMVPLVVGKLLNWNHVTPQQVESYRKVMELELQLKNFR